MLLRLQLLTEREGRAHGSGGGTRAREMGRMQQDAGDGEDGPGHKGWDGGTVTTRWIRAHRMGRRVQGRDQVAAFLDRAEPGLMDQGHWALNASAVSASPFLSSIPDHLQACMSADPQRCRAARRMAPLPSAVCLLHCAPYNTHPVMVWVCHQLQATRRLPCGVGWVSQDPPHEGWGFEKGLSRQLLSDLRLENCSLQTSSLFRGP